MSIDPLVVPLVFITQEAVVTGILTGNRGLAGKVFPGIRVKVADF